MQILCSVSVLVAMLREGKKRRTFSSYHTLPSSNAFDLIASAENYNGPYTPPHKLELFVGMKVMLMRNLKPSRKLSNGSILDVLDFDSHTVTCLSPLGETVTIPRINFSYQMGTVNVVRRQFPLTAAYAATINKSQGETLQKVILDLRDPCFMHGQRTYSREVLPVVISPNGEITSIVYKDLLKLARLLDV